MTPPTLTTLQKSELTDVSAMPAAVGSIPDRIILLVWTAVAELQADPHVIDSDFVFTGYTFKRFPDNGQTFDVRFLPSFN